MAFLSAASRAALSALAFLAASSFSVRAAITRPPAGCFLGGDLGVDTGGSFLPTVLVGGLTLTGVARLGATATLGSAPTVLLSTEEGLLLCRDRLSI